MKHKILLTTIVTTLLLTLIPMDRVVAQNIPTTIGAELDPTEIDFGLVNESELWLKSGSELYYTQDAGEQWRKITPQTNLFEPYLLTSFTTSNLGFVLFLTQTETTVDLEIHKTSSQGNTWSLVTGNLEEKINQKFSQPFGEIQMQWLDEENAMVLVKEFTSSNFSLGTLFVSNDGGGHWSAREVPVAENFVFLDQQIGFMLNPADSQSLYRSLDGGKSWTLLELSMPQSLDSNLFESDLPIKLKNQQVYLPIKITEGEAEGVDFLVKIEPKATPKSMISTETSDIIPILPPSKQKQPSNTIDRQISVTQTLDAQDLWIGLTGGDCHSLPTEEGGVEITCETSWQMLRSQSGGLGWENIKLPGELREVKKNYTLNTRTPQVNPKDVQPQADAWVRTFIGHAFDKCEIPTLSQLQRWFTSSPYKAVNLYIGGISRYCSNAALSATYLRAMNLQGWQFIPTWVGPQAPCTSYKNKFPYDVNLAYQAGVDNANQARTKLMSLGLSNPDGTGSIIYLDLEHFAYSSTCSAAARAYVNGWTTRLSQLGIYSGLYSTSSGINDNRYFDISKPPSAVWIAEWYQTPGFRPDETVWGLRYLPDYYWVYHQRILQYSGGHTETWGGVAMDVDCNVADGKTAVPYGSLSHPYRRFFPFISKH